ncbi:Crp/Fnr family transcriptional regulator [Garciella nitratireducens]|uniref:Crp/Fnr family transcriptional regulator n=1 Tax=Garciella nitratireducens TaxID=218205 RepID=UPI000DEADDB3|nr:Crp/Fnr family transcriptional regulator [Garciella nitratireducens]RBP44060.1 CRP/FNR family transcriptional regulator [Garciella nitratireducens]
MKNEALFSMLTQEDRKFLKNHMEQRTYKKGEIIFTPLDQCNHLSIILDGEVKLCKYSADGQEQILSFLGVGDVFGEAIVFQGDPYVVTVIAERETTVQMIHRDVLLTLTQRNENFTLAFFQEFTKKIKLLNNKIEMLSLKNIKQKIARYLLNLSKEQRSSTIRLPYSKQKIAFLLGTSREVLSRNFSEMEREGYIQSKGRNIFLLNILKLESIGIE